MDDTENVELQHQGQGQDANVTQLSSSSPPDTGSSSEPAIPIGQLGGKQFTGEEHLSAVPGPATRSVGQQPFNPGSTGNGVRPLHILNGVEMTVSVELGRTRMLVKDLLSLGPGSLVELDRPTGSPVDILVNGTLLAHGEVVVVDDEFGVRVTDVVGSSEHEEQSLSGLGESRS
ncbi:MAG: flagellar motor switch protein FliN [Actinobacteria bacterium]|nr:flagellar motor switch protein FliN [Actinomycetota bacterium]MCL6094625.1 flagellar motor switch protein FliN [Actinomycetota bacterium]